MYKKMITFTVTSSLLFGCQDSEQNGKQDSSNSVLPETEQSEKQDAPVSDLRKTEQDRTQDVPNSVSWETLTELDQADSTEIVDGRNGKRVSVTDEKEIEAVKRFINGLEIKKTDYEEVIGTSHHINLKNEGEVTDALFFLGERLTVNGKDYEIQNDVDTALLNTLLETHEHVEYKPEEF